MRIIITMSFKTTLMVVALVAALAIATAGTLADSTLAARPLGVPPSTPPGEGTGNCASAAQGQAADDCPKPGFRGP